MCGIAGSKSRESGFDLYQQNLARGYYSSSVTVIGQNGKGVLTIKKEGALELNEIPKGGDYYLFHSRGPTVETNHFEWDDNHPFTYGRFSVAHNGIIENADELYKQYNPGGTLGVDSRIIPYLLDHEYRMHNDVDLAVKKTLEKLKGTFGLWIYDNSSSIIRIIRHDITLFTYGTEFTSSNGGYLKPVDQDNIFQFDIMDDAMSNPVKINLSTKPKYFIGN